MARLGSFRDAGERMITYNLAGKTALVTGGASGIGLATSAMLGRNGAKVAINFLADDPRGKEAVAGLNHSGHMAIEAPGNVGDAVDCERMVKKAIDDLGRLDLHFQRRHARYAPENRTAGARPHYGGSLGNAAAR
jgi:hypothetical protein